MIKYKEDKEDKKLKHFSFNLLLEETFFFSYNLHDNNFGKVQEHNACGFYVDISKELYSFLSYDSSSSTYFLRNV